MHSSLVRLSWMVDLLWGKFRTITAAGTVVKDCGLGFYETWKDRIFAWSRKEGELCPLGLSQIATESTPSSSC